KGVGENVVMPFECGSGIAVEWGTHCLCDFRNRHIFGVQNVVNIMKVIHEAIRSKQGIKEEWLVGSRLWFWFVTCLANILLLDRCAWTVEIALAAATGNNHTGYRQGHNDAAEFLSDLRHSISFVVQSVRFYSEFRSACAVGRSLLGRLFAAAPPSNLLA